MVIHLRSRQFLCNVNACPKITGQALTRLAVVTGGRAGQRLAGHRRR
ncbi:MAG TPA: hypothetical protein VFG35_17405 [Actinoplanes sp.]|nr:hypothetical protein [Actinoplanes sp.]